MNATRHNSVYILLTNFEYSVMVLAKVGGIDKVLESSVDCYLPTGYGVKPVLRSLGWEAIL